MCDTTMFGPMKKKHEQFYSQWRLHNPTKTMNDVEFVKILKQINDAVIKKESIINGWRATGLQPFNFNNLNTTGLLTKSSGHVYDFKGDYVDSPELNCAIDVSHRQPNVRVLSDIVVDPSSELYVHNVQSAIATSKRYASSGKFTIIFFPQSLLACDLWTFL